MIIKLLRYLLVKYEFRRNIKNTKASNILMAGFDGYGIGDMRNAEMNNLINIYRTSLNAKEIYSITDTEYDITEKSIYSLL